MTDYLNPSRIYTDGRTTEDYSVEEKTRITPALPELTNESEEVNPDSHQHVDNDSTNRRKSVKQKCRNLHSETAETCILRCDYCGKYAKESDLTTEYTKDKYLICRRCKENA